MKKFQKTLPVLIAIAFIIFMSIQAPDASTMEANWFVKGLAKINSEINHREVNVWLTYVLVRKFAHTIEYIILGIAVAVFFSESRHSILYPMLICMVCSVMDQCSKIYIPGREFDITDLPFDVMGYVIGILLIVAVRKR